MLRLDLLVAKENDAVTVKDFQDAGAARIGQWRGEIDATHLGTQIGCHRNRGYIRGHAYLAMCHVGLRN
jgi:hypothetical protein